MVGSSTAAQHSAFSVPPQIREIRSPDPALVRSYLANAALGSIGTCGLGFPIAVIALIPLYIRYRTMTYSFDDHGVGVRWGFIFRHEYYLTYEKIQDIHLSRGFIERWFGLGTVAVQTASGTAGAEISLIGLTRFDAVRDYLYSRMRGGHHADEKTVSGVVVAGDPHDVAPPCGGSSVAGARDRLAWYGAGATDVEVVTLLKEIRDHVIQLKERLPQNPPTRGES